MKVPSFYIKTFGCQMNQADSDDLALMFLHRGFTPAGSQDDATLVHVNTCAVRDKAEQKFYSFMGGMKQRKERGEKFLVGAGGCVAELANLSKRFKFLDYEIGAGDPKEYEGKLLAAIDAKLPEIGFENEARASAAAAPDNTESLQKLVPGMTHISRFYNVVRGCTVDCTFCVVPNVRGAEKSKTVDEIARDVRRMTEEEGVVETTLLGQNILAYGLDLAPRKRLLDVFLAIHDIEKLKRIRFVTSHPSFVTDAFLKGMAELPKVCRHFHIPYQSGDDEVLKNMNRGYNIDLYRRKIGDIRAVFPDCSITTDLIVGFPGETDAQFRKTLDVLTELQIDQCFSFAYSPRPGTVAFDIEDDVPDQAKKERLNELIALQTQVALRKNEAIVGSVQEILIETPPAAGEPVAKGRTNTNKLVDCDCDPSAAGDPALQPGELLKVEILRASPYNLFGRPA